MTSLLENLSGFFTGINDFFGDYKNKLFQDKLNNNLTVISGITDEGTLNTYINNMDPDIIHLPEVQAAISSARKRLSVNTGGGLLDGIAKALVNGFKLLDDQLTKDITDGINTGLSGAKTVGDVISKGIAEEIGLAIISMFESQGHKLPVDERQKLTSVITPVLSLGMGMAFSTGIAELIQPMKNMGFGNISHAIYDTVGFHALSDSYIGPIRRTMIEVPTEYNIHTLIQPFHPSMRLWRRLAVHRYITEEDVKTILRAEGIQEIYIQPIYDSIWTQPSLLNLVMIAEYSKPDDTWLKDKLTRIGYSDADQPIFADLLNQRLYRSTIANIYTIKKAQFLAGQINRAQYEAFLQGQGIKTADASGLIDELVTEQQVKDTSSLVSLFEKKYLAGKMSDAELTSALTSLGRTDEYVNWRLKVISLQKLAKLDAQDKGHFLTRVDYVNGYKRGMLTRDQAILSLVTMGYSQNDAEFIINLEDLTLEKVVITPGS